MAERLASPPLKAEDLYSSPNALARHYARFRVDQRLLLTGHSHQAWPDRSFLGQEQAWMDAAEYVDQKWALAAQRADRLRRGLAARMDDTTGLYALGANTHELVVRFLSALPFEERSRLVTTDGEFHSIRRQLRRLEEAGLEVVRIPADPADTVGERLAEACDDRVAAVLVSSVFYRSAEIAGGLEELAAACQRHGCELLVDVYHTLNVVPFSIPRSGLDSAFVVGGGYKYLQMGEGNCFLRLPSHAETLRPVITGWFSEFSSLGSTSADDRVGYGQGADRFAGATYDPTSHYRAAEVFDFFDEQGMTTELLREVSQHQIALLATGIDRLDLPPSILRRDHSRDLRKIGGFLALESSRAGQISTRLLNAGVHTDFREDVLRLGPAPYLSDRQIEQAVDLLGDVVRRLE